MEELHPEKSDTRPPNIGLQTDASRRQFLGVLGGGAAASIGVSGTAIGQETPVVTMGNTYFDPIGLSVEPGTTVRFEIDAGSHSAIAYSDRIPSGATPFDSTVISEGGFEHTFDTPGAYDYYCIPHQSMGMVGRIVVGEPGGPAEDSPIPDGNAPESELIVEQGAVTIDEFDDSDKGARGGMMGVGPGMMTGGGPGWMVLVPLGFLTVVLGLVGGVAYWAFSRATDGPGGDDSVMATLQKQYARGDIDEEEFMERKRRLQQENQHGN